jgi:basic membrane protein A
MIPLLLISLALVATCLITLISSTFSATAAEGSSQTGHTEVRVIHFINGNLGDNSFFDSAASGLDRAEKDLGVSVETIQAGYNKTNWQPTIDAAASRDDYDILIAGTSDMSGPLQSVAKEHPDKRFILYDALAKYSDGNVAGNVSNIYSLRFRQNEGSYLAGVYAASMTKSGVIGVVGDQNNPIINDFIAGYE